ncbi:MAG: Hsp70 family protein [Bacteroidia bacterium]
MSLLQEPIVASLAYANQDETEKFEEGQWLVYDLGGGTFDVALVKIQDGEMKVVDHEGDNFPGGMILTRESSKKSLFLISKNKEISIICSTNSKAPKENTIICITTFCIKPRKQNCSYPPQKLRKLNLKPLMTTEITSMGF